MVGLCFLLFLFPQLLFFVMHMHGHFHRVFSAERQACLFQLQSSKTGLGHFSQTRHGHCKGHDFLPANLLPRHGAFPGWPKGNTLSGSGGLSTGLQKGKSSPSQTAWQHQQLQIRSRPALGRHLWYEKVHRFTEASCRTQRWRRQRGSLGISQVLPGR